MKKNEQQKITVREGTDHSVCAAVCLILLSLILVLAIYHHVNNKDAGRKELLAEQETKRTNDLWNAWIDKSFPGYLGDDADWSYSPIKPIVDTNGWNHIEFGLSTNGYVVWRNSRQHSIGIEAGNTITYKRGYGEAKAFHDNKVTLDSIRSKEDEVLLNQKIQSLEASIKALEPKDDSITTTTGTGVITNNIFQPQTNGWYYLKEVYQ